MVSYEVRINYTPLRLRNIDPEWEDDGIIVRRTEVEPSSFATFCAAREYALGILDNDGAVIHASIHEMKKNGDILIVRYGVVNGEKKVIAGAYAGGIKAH